MLLNFFSPYLGAIKIAVVVAALGGAFYYGHHTASTACQADKVAALQSYQAAYEAKDKAYQALAKQYEESKNVRIEVTKAIKKKVDKIVTRPIYHVDCFDGDGLKLSNQALDGNISNQTVDGDNNDTN